MVARTRIAIISGEPLDKIGGTAAAGLKRWSTCFELLQRPKIQKHPPEDKATFHCYVYQQASAAQSSESARACTLVLSLLACVPRLPYPAKAHGSISGVRCSDDGGLAILVDYYICVTHEIIWREKNTT